MHVEEVSGEDVFHYSSLTVKYRADKKGLIVPYTTLTMKPSILNIIRIVSVKRSKN